MDTIRPCLQARVVAFGSQDLGFRTSINGHWVSRPLGFRTSTDARKLSILRSSFFFPSLLFASTVTFLCVQWSQTHRQTSDFIYMIEVFVSSFGNGSHFYRQGYPHMNPLIYYIHKFYYFIIILVGTRNGQTQSARGCKPALLHLALRTWVSGPRQMHRYMTLKALHPLVVLSFSCHFSLRPVVTDARPHRLSDFIYSIDMYPAAGNR